MGNSTITPEQTQQLISVLYEIAKNVTLLVYYLADGTRHWHAFVSFLHSWEFAITAFASGLLGYVLGAKK